MASQRPWGCSMPATPQVQKLDSPLRSNLLPIQEAQLTHRGRWGWRRGEGGGQVHMWEQKQAKHKLLSWFKRKFRAPGRLENPPRGQYSTQMWSQNSFVVLKHGEWFKQHSISSRLSSTAVCTKSTPYPVAREDNKPGPVKDSKAKTSGCTCQ